MAPQLVGTSPAFKKVLDAISLVGPVDSGVLLLGETGTGKELIAQAIHEAGPRRHHRFVAVNCAAIPAGLLESELFGHERGAFTGAVSQSPGRFQNADRGTLFLDEIGDLPLELQPKLLRVLQDQQIDRLGSGGRSLPIDVRVIAATNQSLPDLIERREFRADLYYRLNVFPIFVPPLRERVEDIGLLAGHFVRRFAERQGKVISHIPNPILEALRSYSWPGNIRELQNVIERAVVETRTTVLMMPELNVRPRHTSSTVRTLVQVEREYILSILNETNWVLGGWNGAAARLGLSRTTLISRMQRLGITRTVQQAAGRPAAHRGRGTHARRTVHPPLESTGSRVPA